MAYKLASVKVLVAEDVDILQNLMRDVLSMLGFKQIIIASGGQTGYQKFLKYNPDLVITDWIMEPEDGLSLARRIRTDPYSPNRYCPVIIMTGFSEERRVLQARDTGINAFLAKPFTTDELYRKLVSVMERPGQFVETTDYFGPDRRQSKMPANYQGPLRRDEDAARGKRNIGA